jgi:methyl-accepting chemotaxis protein
MIGVADVVERSSKDTRDASLNLERVANNLEQLTRADFQKMTDGVMKSNQDLVKEVQKTVSEMTEVTDKVEEFATQLGKVNQPAQALADAAKQLSQIANKKPWWQLW